MTKSVSAASVANKVKGNKNTKNDTVVAKEDPIEELEAIAETEAPLPRAESSKSTVTTEATEEANVDIRAEYMDSYIKQYLDVNDGYLDTDMKISLAIAKFKQVLQYSIDNPVAPVLDRLVKMFRENRERVLAEELALQGITKLPADMQMRLSIVYRLFFDYTAPVIKGKKKYSPNLDIVRDVLKDDRLVNYCSEKFN